MRFLLFPSLLWLAACGSADPLDGRWEAEILDGQNVRSRGYVIHVKNKAVTSGRDGCNAWGRSDQPGLIVSDAQECPHDPLAPAYWQIADAAPFGGRLLADGRLRVSAGGHKATFRRAGD
jgi:hypothetical protein